MNKNDLLCLFHSPYSAWGLKHRASKLPESNPYRNFLLILAELREKNKITIREAKFLTKLARQGKWKDVVWALNAEYELDELELKLLGEIPGWCF